MYTHGTCQASVFFSHVKTQGTDPSVIKQLLVIDYTLETQQPLDQQILGDVGLCQGAMNVALWKMLVNHRKTIGKP